MRHRSCARDVLAALADDHGQFGFVVDLRRHLGRHEHVVVRADNALGHLGEDDGPFVGLGRVVLEHRSRQFFGVRMVVAPHAPEVALRLGQRRIEHHVAQVDCGTGGLRKRAALGQGFDQRQHAEVRLGLCELQWGDGLAVGGNEADLAVSLARESGDSHEVCSCVLAMRQL
ncbi:hypothetical protein D3C87_1464970 [compost metagenome]